MRKSFSLPTRDQWLTAFDSLSKKEKFFILGFFGVAVISGIVLLRQFDTRFATQVPAAGGSLTEGIVGAPRFVNPLLAISDADHDLVSIIYAGLMKSDGHGGLTPQLAERYEVSDDGLVYTFYLRDKLVWHDSKPLTADDVVFTVELAQNPAIRSTKFANWEGINAIAKSDRIVEFHLKRPFAPFLENTTLGILPKHLWQDITSEEFSASTLNIKPVGAGPYSVDSISKTSAGITTSYTLAPFKRYQPHAPYLSKIILRFFRSETELKDAFENGEIDSTSSDTETQSSRHTQHAVELPRVVGVFLNQDTYQAFRDSALREAMELSVDRERIIKESLAGAGKSTSLPIPPGTFGYNKALEHTEQNNDRAREILKKAGYEDSNNDGILEKQISKKEKVAIAFTLTTANAPELIKTAALLKTMWREIGIDVTVQPLEQGDLKEDFIRPRNYQALLFGQIFGDDPDLYAFWHTSQRKHPGVNLALYANTKVDKILEDARQMVNTEKRKDLYKAFTAEIIKDRPAIFLYSALLHYVTPNYLHGLDLAHIPNPQARFTNIDGWYVSTKYKWNILLPKK